MKTNRTILGLLVALCVGVAMFGHLTRPPALREARAQTTNETSDLGSVWNLTAPGSGLIFTTAKRPLAAVSAFRLSVTLTTSSVFSVQEYDGTTTFVSDFNSGTALSAACTYTFVMESRKTTPAGAALQYNFKVAAGVVVRELRVTEVFSGAL